MPQRSAPHWNDAMSRKRCAPRRCKPQHSSTLLGNGASFPTLPTACRQHPPPGLAARWSTHINTSPFMLLASKAWLFSKRCQHRHPPAASARMVSSSAGPKAATSAPSPAAQQRDRVRAALRNAAQHSRLPGATRAARFSPLLLSCCSTTRLPCRRNIQCAQNRAWWLPWCAGCHCLTPLASRSTGTAARWHLRMQ